MSTTIAGKENTFLEEVLAGLSAPQKFLSSKYFYDKEGDSLFQQIMDLDEYYLTNKELEIFEGQKQEILQALLHKKPFRIIELGAGDGTKTKVLLKHFIEQGVDFTYTPVDISGNVLRILEENLRREVPGLKIESYQGDYFKALGRISEAEEKDVVFFLGSNVGNFPQQDAEVFLSRLNDNLKSGDQLFMGVDLKKDPAVILSAYNDSEGVTQAFNFNLLKRINRDLDADFDLDEFMHYPYYNPHTGECRSYLISRAAQVINISGEQVHFRKWEAIFMEVSKKYDRRQLQDLAASSGFQPKLEFTDSQGWFSNVLWEK